MTAAAPSGAYDHDPYGSKPAPAQGAPAAWTLEPQCR
jgi:hypothetical protein